MKKVLSLLLVMLILASTLALVSCGGDKRVPVYQGMTIGSATKSLSADNNDGSFELFANTNNGNGNDGDNGNHYGHGNQKPGDVDGDYDGRNDKPDKDNPYPDNDESENIENEIKSSLNVEGSVYDIYYASANEDIYIYIHIDNPDNYEIMSFTLNGKKYSNYMFEDGSDMETIILKYNVGANSGVVGYTIDAIKYIDGTEIKDVIIDGNKTVMAGICAENQIVSNVANVSIGTNSFSFVVNLRDNDDLVAFSGGVFKAVLYDGDEIVQEIDLAEGENSIYFDNLKTHTLYQYAIIGYYDNLSGDGFGMHVISKDVFYTKSVVLFDNVVIGQDKVDFTFLWNEEDTNNKIESLKLYKDGNLVKELSTSATSISGLLSNNTYTLVAEYLNAGQSESIYIEFTTLAKGMPGLNLNKTDATQDSIGFEIVEVDEENVGSITKIELVSANGTISANDVSVREFKNLLSNNSYTVRVTYEYDLNDGNGTQTIIKELEIITLAKTTPYINVSDEKVDMSSIKADFSISDIDNTLVDYKLELFKGTTLVKSSTSGIDFTSLDYYTQYTLKITCTYNLNDGNGDQTEILEYKYRTDPYIDVTDCKIVNTSAVSEGDTIFMQVTLNNPAGMPVESVVINGKTYSVAGASTSSKIFIEIVYNGQFVGGDTHLKIDQINTTVDGEKFIVTPQSEFSDSVFINGKLEVISIEYVNKNFEHIDYILGDVPFYVLITVNNPTGYTIDSIKYTNEMNTRGNLKKLDDNRWYYEDGWDYGNGMTGVYSLTLDQVSYSNEYINKTIDVDVETAYCKMMMDDTPVYISTPEDLLRMGGDHYYVLTNDIDLSGREWRGASFSGIFEGNGYAIKNMSFVGTVGGENVTLGIFSSVNGVIQNLNIENATIIADCTGTGSVDIGFLAGITTQYLRLNNCSVDESSVLNISYSADTDCVDGSNCAGGFIGYSNSSSTFTNCTSSGTLSGSSCTGGFIGHSYYSSSTFTNCTNSGTLSGSGYTGGFIGHSNDSSSTFTNCTNSGNKGFIGIISHDSSANVVNSYSLSQNAQVNGKPCTVAQLNSKTFYIETLGWSEDIWDFSNLDVENGKGPTLK